MEQKLDAYDLNILEILQKDGRITKTKLAQKIHLSPSPTWERLKRLETSGIITGYQAKIDTRKLFSATTVQVEVILRHHGIEDFKRFEDAVIGHPEITECLATGGGIDYLMKIVVSDIDTYQRFMDKLLESDIGIDRYFTYIVTKPVKSDGELPLAGLLEKSAESTAF